MRKIAMTGLALVLVMFLMTCDQNFLDDDGLMAYTDVVYSQDGDTIAITIYLDGEMVPVEKSQRAMTRELARMAYDFFEVIFIGPEPTDDPSYNTLPKKPIARSSWELGQGAGISGVYRGPAGAGHDYAWIPPEERDLDPEFYDRSIALIFVGRKDGKTLFGVGRIGDVDHMVSDRIDVDNELREDVYLANGFPKEPITIITDESKSVTFYVTAVKTGLLVGSEEESTSEDPDEWGNPYNIKTDSFNFCYEAGITDKDDNPMNSTLDWDRAIHSSRSPLGSYNYPMYSLPMRRDTGDLKIYPYQNAEYTFKGAADEYKNEIKLNQSVASGAITVEKRFPRYVQGGRYYQPKENIDSDTILRFDDVKYGPLEKGDPINNVVPLNFQTTVGMGIFSFYIEMPVYMITKEESTNGVLEAEVWKIRTGFGSELYSLDTGKSSGGCVLIGVGVTSLDWLEIEWGWVGNAPAIPDVPDVP